MKTSKISPSLKIIALSCLFGWLYLFTRTYVYSYDGLCYSLDVEFGPVMHLFHPNHLLYSPLSRCLYRGALTLGYPLRALPFLQIVNALMAGLAVGLFYGILARRFGDLRAFLGTCVLGLSYAFWSEAVDPGCYAWATLAACLLVGVLVSAEEWPSFGVGLACGAAILFHQMLILTVPAFLIKLGRRKAGPFLGGVLLLAGGAYVAIAAVFHRGSLNEALYWAFGPGGPPPDTPILSTFWFSLALGHNATAAWGAWVHNFVVPLPESLAWLSILIHLAVLALVIFVLESSRRYFKNHSFSGDTVAALWVWVLVLSVFQFFFWVGALRYRLLVLPPMIYLFLNVIERPADQKAKNRLGCAVAGLALGLMAGINFFLAMAPQSRVENSPNFLRARWVSHRLQPDDVFIFAGGTPDSIMNVYVAYFVPQVLAHSIRGYYFAHPQGDLSELLPMVVEARRLHQKVYVEAALYDPKIQKDLETIGQTPPGTLQKWLDGLGKRKSWIGLAPEGYKIYEVS